MDKTSEFIKKMGICDEGNIINDDDYETSEELDDISDLLIRLDSVNGGSENGK